MNDPQLDDQYKVTKYKIVPSHVAIIMDGNGRWAKKYNRPRTFGHLKAEKAILTSVKFCLEKNVEVLTLFAFSTENWKRPKDEVLFLMQLVDRLLKRNRKLLFENSIRLTWMGRKDRVPKDVRNNVEQLISETKHHTKMILCIALDYGSRAEITEVAKKLASMVVRKEIVLDEIAESTIDKFLYTKDLPELDLIIRTSGEFRLSNFLLWQAAYAELYFCDTLWPDFERKDLEKAFNSYTTRSRRWGNI